MYTVPHIHFITCFYVRWLRLHPHFVFRYFFFTLSGHVSVHFLSPLFQFLFPTHIALYPFLSKYCFGLSSLFLLRHFPVVIPVRSSYYDGLCHIDLGVSSFLCRFHVHMFIVGVSDVAKLIFLLYIHFLVVVFSSPLTSFHLYSCSLHSYLWRDLRFGNVILVHQCIPMLYQVPHIFVLGFFRQCYLFIPYHSFPL